MRRLLSLVVSCLLAGAVGLTALACDAPFAGQSQPTPEPPATPLPPNTPAPPPTPAPTVIQRTGSVVAHFDYATVNMLSGSSDDLGKLVAHSTVIVIGTIPNNYEPAEVRAQDKISSDVQAVGGSYNVQVERYLKGTGGNTIPVVQFYGLDFTDKGQRRQMRDNNTNLLLGKGNRYLLFLKENGSIPGYWSGTIHPYKFLLKDGLAKAESPVGDLDGAFPEQSEADFISSIESRIAESP